MRPRNNKIAGSILLSTAGLVAAIGAIGAQVAYAIVLSGFYAGALTGVNPPGPQDASLHWLVIAAVVVLAVSGLYLLFAPERSE
jgi:hypothetical protein